MAGLLVSVRSAREAKSALAGGATVIDVKEPDRGPLGRADVSVWQAVRRVTPREVPVSVALGELAEWAGAEDPTRIVRREAFAGMAYRKLGLAGAGRSWAGAWAALRRAWGPGPAWVAVVYADWQAADAPHPREVLDVALAVPECAGVLIDTFEKIGSCPLDETNGTLIEDAHGGGRFVALAGSLTESAIARLAPLGADLFAVRGAACHGGDRRASVHRDRVSRLARVTKAAGRSSLVPTLRG